MFASDSVQNAECRRNEYRWALLEVEVDEGRRGLKTGRSGAARMIWSGVN
jgi:hypothetical protein